MPDWTVISSLATAGGTLVLATATFSSVRSANRAARTAERAFQAGVRPVLFNSNLDDPVQKIGWGDQHRASLGGGQAVVDHSGAVIYLAMSLRNAGAGIAVIRGWWIAPAPVLEDPTAPLDDARERFVVRPDPDTFRPQGRDLYVPSTGVSFWQAAIRTPDDPDREAVLGAIDRGCPLTISLLYGDHEGGQRAISLFMVTPVEDRSAWLCSVSRHWNLDRDDPG